MFAVHCGDGLDARLHRQVVAHVEGRVRANGLDNLGGDRSRLLRGVPPGDARQEQVDIKITRMKDHDVVVVSQFFDRGQGGVATRPRILIM